MNLIEIVATLSVLGIVAATSLPSTALLTNATKWLACWHTAQKHQLHLAQSAMPLAAAVSTANDLLSTAEATSPQTARLNTRCSVITSLRAAVRIGHSAHAP